MSDRFFVHPGSQLPVATNLIANCAGTYWARVTICLVAVAFLLGACSALPTKPIRATMYDFGPGPLASQPAGQAINQPASQPAPSQPPLPALAIEEISTAGGALDNTAVLYRLGYDDAQELRPYSQARWSMLPAQLVRQRLRERLSQRRVVLNAREGVALNRVQNASLPMLRLELEEFSQLFSAPDASVGLIRLHATLVDITPAGEKLVGQRSFGVQRPASSADAPGGVRALTEATEAAIEEIEQWLLQMPAR